jgi:CRP-like cAMP-binding protein
LRLVGDDQRELLSDAVVERYGSEELIQRTGEVPERMTFIVTGRVRLTGVAPDGGEISIATLEEGGFLGQTTLTRQAVLGNARAIGEVTVVHVDRDRIETLVQRNPLLMQEFGRTIAERRAQAREAITAAAE